MIQEHFDLISTEDIHVRWDYRVDSLLSALQDLIHFTEAVGRLEDDLEEVSGIEGRGGEVLGMCVYLRVEGGGGYEKV
jgi:hypothetical protein